MSDVEVLRKLVNELSRTYDDVAIVLNKAERVMVKLWNTEPSVVQNWFDWDLGVRLSKNRRMWILWLYSKDPEYILKSSNKLLELADKIEESEIYSPLPEPSKCSPLEDAYDHNVEKYMEDPSKPVELMVNEALSQHVERVAGMLTLGKLSKTLVTSKGFECEETKTFVEAYLRAFKKEHSGHWAYGSTRVDFEKLKTVGQKAGYYATLTERRADFTPGKYNIVISPLVAGNLFNYIARMSSALMILIGFSFLARFTPGSRIASDKLSLYDKPRDPLLHGGTGFDDEGTSTYDKPIVEKGVYATMLHNTGTAKRFGVASTGNAGWIMPRPWNIEISSGELREDELVQELGDGVLITNNWYTRLQNYFEGYFSTVTRDATLLVKNGEIIGDIGRVRITSSFPHLLSNIKDMTRTVYDIAWWEVSIPTRAPYIIVQDVQLTKPEV
ncbi:MAG: TldD/PmbA family protein [Desulfurococcaceae archaeon]